MSLRGVNLYTKLESKRVPRTDQAGLAFPKSKRVKVAKSKKAATPEAVLQSQAEQLLQYHCVSLHLPQEMFMAVSSNPYISKGAKIETMTKLKNWPDIMAFIPISDKYNLAWCPELKSDVGKLRHGQAIMGKEIAMPVIRDFDTFERELGDFKKMADTLKKLCELINRLGNKFVVSISKQEAADA